VLFAELKELRYAYVVFDDNYYSCVDKLIKYFEANDVFPRGRYGSWIYNAMEDSILAGRDVALRLNA
jgi:protoporphyrinogen oxidase